MIAWGRKFTIIYFGSVILAVASLLLDLEIGFLTFDLVPLPMLIIGLLLKFRKNYHPLMPLMIVGTLFSFGGDFLMLLKIEESMFITIAICMFIVSQISYGLLYVYSIQFGGKDFKPTLTQRLPEIITFTLLSAYASEILQRTEVFFLPGLLYSFFGISTFVLALNRRLYFKGKTFNYVLSGASMFIMSASLSGIDLYSTNVVMHAISIVLYTSAHFLCTLGILTQIKDSIAEQEKLVNASRDL